MARNDDNIVIEGVRLIFRNFSGKGSPMNREGDRNFGIILDEALARRMEEDGFNVKMLKARDEGDPPAWFVKVTVKYKNLEGKSVARPPKAVLITSRGKTTLGEDEIGTLDWADILNVDLILRPFDWQMSDGKKGTNLYLQSIYVTIQEDALELKYADLNNAHDEEPADGLAFH